MEEEEEDRDDPTSGGSPSLLRRRVIRGRTSLLGQRAATISSNTNNSNNLLTAALTGSPPDSPPLSMPSAGERPHRLQRADAKSRKTFKIKRHRSTIKGNIIRSATMKAGGMNTSRKTPLGKTISNEPLPEFGLLERMETQPEEQSGEETSAGPAEPPPPPTPITEVTEVKLQPAALNGTMEASGDLQPPAKPRKMSKKRYLPAKSKSHDADDIVGGCGTARARIARHGARSGGGGGGGGGGGRSRSPSHSPVRLSSQPRSPSPGATSTSSSITSATPTAAAASVNSAVAAAAVGQAYVAKCDSVESLNCGENAALLNAEDKSRSQTSLLIYFDDKDMQDTVV